MLKHVHTRIEEVQQRIQQLLPSNAIVVGHSLNFDLDALQVSVLLYFSAGLLDFFIVIAVWQYTGWPKSEATFRTLSC